LKEDGWYVIEGQLRDGSSVDLFRDGAPVAWEKPELISALYKSERWRKYMMNLWAEEYAPYRLYYLQYLCRDWNAEHIGGQRLTSLKMYFMLKITQPNYEPVTAKPVLAGKYDCSEK
jgi:hypothetical protein